MSQKHDVIVVGAGLSGITASYMLTALGYRVCLLEKAPIVGGLSGSFQDERGNFFDYGLHILDEDRSALVTRFFKKALKNKLVRTKLSRGIVLDGHLFPYNSPAEEWPEPLRKMFHGRRIVDDLPLPPPLEDLSRVYGKEFVDFIVDQGLTSQPIMRWKKQNGVAAHTILNWLYPWFFPRSERIARHPDVVSRYHERVRAGDEQYILYPSKGGFATFLEEVVADFDRSQIDVRMGIKDLRYETDQKTKSILSIQADGETFTADKVFWCAPIAQACKLFGVETPKLHTQMFAMGNFEFSEEIPVDYQEVLLADPNHKFSRVSFPGKYSSQPDKLAQVEFLYPEGEYNLSPETWCEEWVTGMKKLGMITPTTKVVNFNLKVMPRGFVTTTPYRDILEIFGKGLASENTNIAFPFWGLGFENINRIVPMVFENVPKILNHWSLQKSRLI